jgi:hypothetical protein
MRNGIRIVRNGIAWVVGNSVTWMMKGIMRDGIARMAGILFGKAGRQRFVERSYLHLLPAAKNSKG